MATLTNLSKEQIIELTERLFSPSLNKLDFTIHNLRRQKMQGVTQLKSNFCDKNDVDSYISIDSR